MPSPQVHVKTAATPNGYPVTITLEELGVSYDYQYIKFDKKEQKTPEFLKLNPNGRIPVIVDNAHDGFVVFETIAILLYLTDKYDTERKISFEFGTPQYYEQLQWLSWAQGGLGPMQGQANHFARYAPEKIPYGIKRYVEESKRLWNILEERLGHQDWLVAEKYSIADIKAACWINRGAWATVTDLEFTDYPNLKKWLERMKARPATVKGWSVPKITSDAEDLKNAEQKSADARKAFEFK